MHTEKGRNFLGCDVEGVLFRLKCGDAKGALGRDTRGGEEVTLARVERGLSPDRGPPQSKINLVK